MSNKLKTKQNEKGNVIEHSNVHRIHFLLIVPGKYKYDSSLGKYGRYRIKISQVSQ